MHNSETEWMLACAKYFFIQYHQKAMKLTRKILLSDEIKYDLFAFISASRSVTWYMKKEYAHTEGFTEWYEPQAKLLDDRWVTLRNITVKEHPPVLSEHVVLVERTVTTQVSPTLSVIENVFEISESFIALKDLENSKSIEEECEKYLNMLTVFVNSCTSKFGSPNA